MSDPMSAPDELRQLADRLNEWLVDFAEVITDIEMHLWWSLQNNYRASCAQPPERSIACIAVIDQLQALAAAAGQPDPRAVVEIGMEHLWPIVYGDDAAAVSPEDES